MSWNDFNQLQLVKDRAFIMLRYKKHSLMISFVCSVCRAEVKGEREVGNEDGTIIRLMLILWGGSEIGDYFYRNTCFELTSDHINKLADVLMPEIF